jgi:hypothetical protein
VIRLLPAEEDRLSAYTRLLRERFGEAPKLISEGAGLVTLPIALCPDCLLPIPVCHDTRCREVI